MVGVEDSLSVLSNRTSATTRQELADTLRKGWTLWVKVVDRAILECVYLFNGDLVALKCAHYGWDSESRGHL